MSQSTNLTLSISACTSTSEISPCFYKLSSYKEFVKLLWSDDMEAALRNHRDGQGVCTTIEVKMKIRYLSEHHREIREIWQQLNRFLWIRQGLSSKEILMQYETDTEITWAVRLSPDTTVKYNSERTEDDDSEEPFFVPPEKC